MIDSNDLNLNFTQEGSTCILASFAIAAEYFTKVTPKQYFEGYCNHFKLNTNNSLEKDYDVHFHEYIKGKYSGNQLIFELYSNSNIEVFIKSRSNFKAQYVEINGQSEHFEFILAESETLLTVFATPNYPDIIGHNFIVGRDNGGLYFIETRKGNTQKVTRIKRLSDLGRSLGDGILLSPLSITPSIL